jgi:hypothetical protein
MSKHLESLKSSLAPSETVLASCPGVLSDSMPGVLALTTTRFVFHRRGFFGETTKSVQTDKVDSIDFSAGAPEGPSGATKGPSGATKGKLEIVAGGVDVELSFMAHDAAAFRALRTSWNACDAGLALNPIRAPGNGNRWRATEDSLEGSSSPSSTDDTLGCFALVIFAVILWYGGAIIYGLLGPAEVTFRAHNIEQLSGTCRRTWVRGKVTCTFQTGLPLAARALIVEGLNADGIRLCAVELPSVPTAADTVTRERLTACDELAGEVTTVQASPSRANASR